MVDFATILAGAIRDAQPSQLPPTSLATVTGSSASGVTVRHDGEVASSPRVYRLIGPAKVGDRVVMLRTGSTYVCAGVITQTQPQSGGGGTQSITYAAATQTQDLTFTHGLGWTPTSVNVTPVDERFIVAVKTITSTQITLRAYYVPGAVLAGFVLTTYWHADR